MSISGPVGPQRSGPSSRAQLGAAMDHSPAIPIDFAGKPSSCRTDQITDLYVVDVLKKDSNASGLNLAGATEIAVRTPMAVSKVLARTGSPPRA